MTLVKMMDSSLTVKENMTKPQVDAPVTRSLSRKSNAKIGEKVLRQIKRDQNRHYSRQYSPNSLKRIRDGKLEEN